MKALSFLVSLLCASMASAQAIHQYPYDSTVTAYTDPSQWPLISAQCHWRPSNSNADSSVTPQLISPSVGHTHMEVKAPVYSEVTGNFTVPFTIVLFQVDGYVDGGESPYSYYGYHLQNIVWDTPTGAPPVMQGDPVGVRMWTGHATVDIGGGVPHGWFQVLFGLHTLMRNGDQTRTNLLLSFYSVIDSTVPATPDTAVSTLTSAQCTGGSARDTFSGDFGVDIASYNDYLPILSPLATAMTRPIPQLYGYGPAAQLPFGTGMTRVDMDLHHGVPGTLLQSRSAPSTDIVILPSPFDPAVLGPGTHKVAAIWQQESGVGSSGITAQEQVAALLVVTVSVGTAAPPPPPPAWMTLATLSDGRVFQQLMGSTTQFRLCPANLTGCDLLTGQ